MSDAPLKSSVNPLAGRYMTPMDEPDKFIYRTFRIPDDPDFREAFNELVSRLNFPLIWNDSADGSLSAIDTAALAAEMWQYSLESEDDVIGQVQAFATAELPCGWLLCDGATYSRVLYPVLYAKLDPMFRVDIESFQVPDLRGRVPVGEDTANVIGGLFPLVISMVGGSPLVGLLLENLWKHQHSVPSHSHTATIQTGEQNAYLRRVADGTGALDVIVSGGGGNFDYADDTTWFDGVTVGGSGTLTTSEEGDNVPHNNMQPFTVLRWAIRAK